MEIVLYLFLLFFLVVGICDTIHSIHIRLIFPKKDLKKIMICRLEDSEAEEQVSYLLSQYKWYGRKCFDSFICLYDKEKIKDINFQVIDEFCFIDKEDSLKLYDMLGEEYGLKSRQH